MAEVSIIVPVYQVEKYIRQCVDSILAQTFTDFELILVDDGSKDRSGEICDEYAGMDERVKVIHKENGGAAESRNTGMDQAAGNYYMFVDSDDYLAPEMLECLYNVILKQNADIVACNYRYCFEDNTENDFSTDYGSETIAAKEVFYFRKNERNYGFWTVVWNKLYRKEIFDKIRFRTGKYFEDEYFANDIYQLDIRIVIVPECLYYYRQHGSSTMKTKKFIKYMDLLEALQERLLVYLRNPEYADQAYKVMIYSLEYLEESRRLMADNEEKKKFVQMEARTKAIVTQLKKTKISMIKKISLLFIGLNPCMVFAVGIRFRIILERFL